MSERVYVAASFEQRDDVAALLQRVRDAGHEVTEDWTTHEEVKRMDPASKAALISRYVEADTEGVKNATVYALLIGDRKSTGAHIEFGIALGAEVDRIVLIGEPDPDQLFYSHPSVEIVANADEFIKTLG